MKISASTQFLKLYLKTKDLTKVIEDKNLLMPTTTKTLVKPFNVSKFMIYI